MPKLFDKRGGFRKLHTFRLATIVQLEKLWFCRRFITHDHREAATRLTYTGDGSKASCSA